MFEIFERKLSAYRKLSTGWLKTYVTVVLPLMSAFLTWKFISSHILAPSPGWVDYGISLAACLLSWLCTLLTYYLDRTAFVLNMALMLVFLAWGFLPLFPTAAPTEMDAMMPGMMPEKMISMTQPSQLPFGLTEQSLSLLLAIALLMVVFYQGLYFFRRWGLFTLPDTIRAGDDWDDQEDEF